MTVAETRLCPSCTSWGFNEPMPEHLRRENYHYADLCARHRGKQVKQRSRRVLTDELNRAFTWWLISMDEKGLKPATVSNNRRAAAQFCRWWLDQMPPDPDMDDGS